VRFASQPGIKPILPLPFEEGTFSTEFDSDDQCLDRPSADGGCNIRPRCFLIPGEQVQLCPIPHPVASAPIAVFDFPPKFSRNFPPTKGLGRCYFNSSQAPPVIVHRYSSCTSLPSTFEMLCTFLNDASKLRALHFCLFFFTPPKSLARFHREAFQVCFEHSLSAPHSIYSSLTGYWPLFYLSHFMGYPSASPAFHPSPSICVEVARGSPHIENVPLPTKFPIPSVVLLRRSGVPVVIEERRP